VLDGLFERFTLPDLTRLARRTVIVSVVGAIVILMVAAVLNAPLVGLGACIGVALGVVNFRMVTRSVVRVGERQSENKRRPLAMNTLSRLGVISAVALGLLFLSFELGFGVLGGLALFQVVLLSTATRLMFAAARPGASSSGSGTIGTSTTSSGPAVDVTSHERKGG